MSTLVEIYEDQPAAQKEKARSVSQLRSDGAILSDLYRERVQFLVQYLFFHQKSPPRHVGVAAVEESTETAHLCFDLAQALANEDRYDVGVIDASPLSVPLEIQLALPAPESPDSWLVAPRLWFVPRQNWLPARSSLTEQNTAHLRELAAEFDFSILHCPSVSRLSVRIGGACDGLVLVVTANQTRCLAARHIKEQIEKIQIPLLGTVLRERRFPIPEALYQRL